MLEESPIPPTRMEREIYVGSNMYIVVLMFPGGGNINK